jgi:branched-chain amino acid transport system ATP-binding protein
VLATHEGGEPATATSPHSQTTPALQVIDLRAAYGDQAVLHGVSLVVPPGACVAVLGTNGAGKTTLMNAIAGLHRPVGGQILLGDKRVEKWPAYQVARAGLCYIPEGRGLFPDLTVAENLRLAVGRSESLHRQFFEHFPALNSWAHRQAGTLSGGEQQMLAMAPAIVGDYQLLLIDELSLGLGPLIVEKLFGLVAAIRERGVAVVLVEQFAERALVLADHAYVIRKGRVVFDGASATLRHQPETLHSLYMGETGS